MLAGMTASIVSLIVDKHSLYDHLKVQYMQDILHDEPMTVNEPAEGETS